MSVTNNKSQSDTNNQQSISSEKEKPQRKEKRKRVRPLNRDKPPKIKSDNNLQHDKHNQDQQKEQEVITKDKVWNWLPLAQPSSSNSCPVLFSKDGRYSFIASGSSIKIHSVQSAALLSTLTLSPAPSTSEPSNDNPTTIRPTLRTRVTSLALNPSNPLQLVVGALDGLLRIWDFTEGVLLRTLDLGAPILHLASHPSLPTQVFVSLVIGGNGESDNLALIGGNAGQKKKKNKVNNASDKGTSNQSASNFNLNFDEEPKAGIYSISLKGQSIPQSTSTFSSETPAHISPLTPRPPTRRMRLAQPRVVRSLLLSPSGDYLLSLNPGTVNIARTAHLSKGFTVHLEAQAGAGMVDEAAFTTAAFHPTESWFATGDERGRVRLWYDVLEETSDESLAKKDKSVTRTGPSATSTSTSTSVLHWHAHPVTALTFTPNGAYLLSGGQEAVIVLWQVRTNHREFVPRVGAPILALSVANQEAGDAEQQIVARLTDGSTVFVGSQKLKIMHTISGVKAGHSPSITSQRSALLPLALQPYTNSLVVPSSHPSSLQFYSPTLDSQLLELEVSPSNRVSSVGRAIEPTRVERVAFSTSEGEGKPYWMATLDKWESGAWSPERQLKFWRWKEGTGFTLMTRIDRPHDTTITSLSFSPSPTSPILLTTSQDGSVKIWSFTSQEQTWTCASSFTYRAFSAIASAWSNDGSMFAVAHKRSVTLWSLAGLELLNSFSCAGLGGVKNVAFVGDEGMTLVAAGKEAMVGWDLLTFEESVNIPVDLSCLTPLPTTSAFLAINSLRDATTSTTYEIDALTSSSITGVLPFPVRQSLPLASSSKDKESSFAVVDNKGEILLVGDVARKLQSSEATVRPTRLPSASTGQSRLFDDLFGTTPVAVPVPGGAHQLSLSTSASKPSTAGSSALLPPALAALDAPAHTLPGARLLWRSMLGDFAVVRNGAAPVEEETRVGAREEEEARNMDVDEPVTSGGAEEGNLRYSSVGSLAEVFKSGLTFVAPTPVAGTPQSGKKMKQ
ncbi:WD40 repeat-like protein [Meredithblackwellia eburnea MCA 4105]